MTAGFFGVGGKRHGIYVYSTRSPRMLHVRWKRRYGERRGATIHTRDYVIHVPLIVVDLIRHWMGGGSA